MAAKQLLLLVASIFLISLWSCSSPDSGGSDTYGSELQEEFFAEEFVGAALCVNCHQDPDVFDDPEFAAASVALTRGYLKGAHVIHSKHVNAASGPYCLDCHDPLGDGPLLEPYLKRAYVPAEGLAAVTCERCHGTGAETATEVGHWGIGPMPDPRPNFLVCGQCHNAELPASHLAENPGSGEIFEDYLASPHASMKVRNETICVKCHNDEGGRFFKNIHTAEDLYNETFPIPGGISPIQCRTCHDAHEAGQLLLGQGDIDLEFSNETFGAAAEYSTCTNCHQPHNAAVFTDQAILDAGLGDTADGPNGDLIYHGKRWTRVISATHYDDPATNYFIEGYAMDPESEGPCRDCHNVHAADITINLQWAESGHAGEIINSKKDAATIDPDNLVTGTYQDVYNVKKAGVDNSYTWAQISWDDSAIGGSCQRCHTATGLKNFLNDPYSYDLSGADNVFNDLVGWTPATGSGQNEMLYCWGCHADNTGLLRNSGYPVPLFAFNDGLFATVPDVGKSTNCAACHGGLGNNNTIRDSERSPSFEGHHAPAAGTVFAAITHTGYEFEGLNYIFPPYRHDKIGLDNDMPESGEGPCVSCHMPDRNHKFAAAEYNDRGIITGVTNPSLCETCHGDPGETLNIFKQGQEEAAALLGGYLSNIIINYLDTDINANFETVPLNAYGAAQNWGYISTEDPAAYVHNSIYAKRLVFDSIDWLDNGVLDGEIFIPAAYGDARFWLRADSNGTAKRL